MGAKEKKDRRQARLEADLELNRSKENSTPRHPHLPVSYLGTGSHLIQVIRQASFNPIDAWDIRDTGTELLLFYSRSVSDFDDNLIGYEKIEFPTSELCEFVEQIATVSVYPFSPREMIGICDGTRYEIAIRGGIQAECRFEWQEGSSPQSWTTLTSLVENIVKKWMKAQPGRPLDKLP